MSHLSKSHLLVTQGMSEYDIKAAIATIFWAWYREHENDVLVSKRILFFTLNIRVRDLRFLFVMLFGELSEW